MKPIASPCALRLGVRLIVSIGLALAPQACGKPAEDNGRPPPEAGIDTVAATITRYHLDAVADGLNYPWAMAPLADGGLLVTERAGRLLRFAAGTFEPAPVAGVPPVLVFGQGGLLDVAVVPGDGGETVFLSYVTGNEDANRLNVLSARLEGGALADTKTIFTANRDKAGGENFGGALLVLPDGSLLISVGDGGAFAEDAQGLMTHFGKIVRVRADGSVPADNPFTQSNEVTPELWTIGHRNIQGLALDGLTGTVYGTEHGPRGGDELNVLKAGHNYGWPAISYGRTEDGVAVSPYTEQEDMEQPMLYWTPAIAPAGLAVYDGAAFPAWTGDIFVAALAGKELRRVDLEEGRAVGQEMLLTELEARLRDVAVGGDGALYVLTDGEDDGRLVRIVP